MECKNVKPLDEKSANPGEYADASVEYCSQARIDETPSGYVVAQVCSPQETVDIIRKIEEKIRNIEQGRNS